MGSTRHQTTTIVLIAALALGACDERDRTRAPRPPAPGASVDASAVEVEESPGPDAAPPEAGAEARAAGTYDCLAPDVPIPSTAACDAGKRYPDCRHQLPDPEAAGGLYKIWRNTIPGHRWGRLSLVRVVLATARDYARLHPGEVITVGDLDAPGPRHKTHRHGVDVDLYLPGLMATENRGSRDYPSNYEGRPEAEVGAKRARVLELAKIVATCARGQVRIYYNDPPVLEAFESWFDRAGLDTPFRRPMERHNLLHLFHFHVTIAKALEPPGVVSNVAPSGKAP